jgi:hypothetical protein
MATPELEIVTDNEAIQKTRRVERLAKLSAVGSYAHQLSRAIASHAVLMSREIKNDRLYLEKGFDAFREYMDNDPDAPMSYHEFNARDKLLDELGAETFDFLSGARLGIAKQEKLVGLIRTEGDEWVITRADGTEERFSKTDAAAAKRLLPTIITEYRELEREKLKADEALGEQEKKLKQGQVDYDKVKAELIEAQKAHGLNVTDNDEDATEFLAMIEVARRAKSRFASMDPKKKRAWKQRILETLGQVQLDFADAFDLGSPDDVAPSAAKEELATD